MYNIRENLDSEMLPFQESFSPALFLFFFLAVILGNVKKHGKQSAEKSQNKLKEELKSIESTWQEIVL